MSYTNGDELQQILDVFIREVHRPTGEQYLPESIYYLCLGIQFYLNLNNRQIDLFDPRYIEFNSTLNKILQNYSPRINTQSKRSKTKTIEKSSIFVVLSEYNSFVDWWRFIVWCSSIRHSNAVVIVDDIDLYEYEIF